MKINHSYHHTKQNKQTHNRNPTVKSVRFENLYHFNLISSLSKQIPIKSDIAPLETEQKEKYHPSDPPYNHAVAPL